MSLRSPNTEIGEDWLRGVRLAGCRTFREIRIFSVSAEHGVKDDFAFLWEHAIFRHPPKKKPLTDRSEILHN
jgi:hypothetical protein